MNRRKLLQAAGLGLVTTAIAKPAIAQAQGPIKIGLIQSMTGPFNDTGKAVVGGAQLYVRQHGDVVAGRRIQLIVKDDATAPDRAKRAAQEMIVNDKVAVIGVGITPSALSVAPLRCSRRELSAQYRP